VRKLVPTKLANKPIVFLILFLSIFIVHSNAVNLVLFSSANDQQIKIAKDSVQEFRTLTKFYADSSQAATAIDYASRYIRATQDLSIINDHFFSNINQTSAYINFKERYKPEFNFLSLFYLFAGFLGLFMVVILNLKRGVSRTSTFLMSLFILLHSLFIIHLSLYVINCQFYFPHTLLMSTIFIFLYGPLIYLLLFIYIFPFYTLSTREKFIILFDQSDILSSEANYIIAGQIISLIVYAYLIINIYRNANKSNIKESKSRKLLWQRNILAIYIAYILIFVLYNTTTSGGFLNSQIVYHFQILTMVGLVFYVSYITYAQPEIFKGQLKLVDPMNLFKYKKSGLTKSFSGELKDQLLDLLETKKIYKQNNLNLNALAEMLDTNRHNTSQIINEHFNMNFFELVNKFRIDEAVRMIKDDKYKDLNIIEIAYEVGYNNKVTFNKSFKKLHGVTPTQYIKGLK